MNLKEALIYNNLKNHPDSAYITPDGKELYALTEGGMFCWTGMNFNELTAEEINIYIQESFNRKGV